jgi:hypothetical protein
MAKSNKKVTEAINIPGPFDIYNSTSFDFPFNSTQGWITGSPWGGMGFNSFGFSQQYDQGYGFLKPVYLTTFQLKQIRERSRQLAFYNEYMNAVINIFKNFVCGDGFQYKVTATSDSVNKKLVQQGQELIDLYCEHNNINEMENEFVWRMLVEGEACARSFENSDGLLTVRWVENDLILPPSDSNDPDISFGIACRHDDIHDVKGYWIVTTPWKGLIPELVPAKEINYGKVLTPSNVKRGLPYSFAVDANFRYAEQILQSMISMALARSKVAMIRKIQNAPPEGVNNLLAKTTDFTITNPATNQGRLNLEYLPNSSVLTTSSNVTYEWPDMDIASEHFETTLMDNLRAIASHFGISEVHLSQHIGSGGSYAAHIVSESPSYRTFARWQKMLGDYFSNRRTDPHQSLMWKQITFAVKKGLLPKNALTDLKIVAQAPGLITKDPLAEAQTAKIWADMGVKSNSTIAAEQGLDYEEQQRHIQNDDNLDLILSTVEKIKKAGIGEEAGKKLMKQYHPLLADDIINDLFTEQNEAEQEEKPKQKAPAKTPKPPQPGR